jgi:membrane dipeptidase
LKEFFKLTEAEDERARTVYSKSIVIDASTIINYEGGTLAKLKKAGITASNHTVTEVTSNFDHGSREISRCLGWINRNSSNVVLVQSAKDVEAAKEKGIFGSILGPQNSIIVENDLQLLPAVHQLGVRIMQLTYQTRNYVGDGCAEKTDAGLSSFGFDLIEKMSEIGMLVDLSHCGRRTTSEAIEASKKPVVFSHTHPYSMAKHIRNKTDEQIHALAEKGGVMGITEYAAICEVKRGVRPTIVDYIDQVEYVADLVGVDHVGIGLDIDETSTPEEFAQFKRRYPELCANYEFTTRRVEGLTELTDCPQIARGLVARGYSDQEITKILGGNFMRVFREVWKEH